MSSDNYNFGEFSLNTVTRRLLHKGLPLPLPPKTFDILKLLVQRSGRVVAKEEIMRRVWSGQFVEDNNLTVRVSAIRRALNESPGNRLIETVPGHGYRFTARVLEERSSGQPHQGGGIRSLAVLPFAVGEGQQRLNYISEGIADGLISRLSQLPNLKVMARNTVFRFTAGGKDPQEVGEELGVEAVLAGRIRLANDKLNLSAELIDVGDGSYVWGAKYARNFANLVGLQDEIAGELWNNLRVELTGAEKSRLTTRHTDSSPAYHLYLKGRYFYNNKRTVKGIRKALSFFKRAVKTDPTYAHAYSGLTDCYVTLSGYGLVPPRRVMQKARTYVLKALELDNSLGEAHASLAGIKADFEWDWEGARRECARALDLSPGNAHVHYAFANFLSKTGELGQAISQLKKAAELDPLSLNINIGLSKLYYFSGNFDEAVRRCHETLEIEPDFAPVNGMLGLIYLQRNQYAQAVRQLKKAIPYSAGDFRADRRDRRGGLRPTARYESDPETIGFLGYAYARAGRRREAKKVLNGMLAMAGTRYVEPHAVALVYIGLGDNDPAFEWLERAYSDRSQVFSYIKVLPLLDPIRSDSRYEDLLRRMRLKS